MVLVQWMMGGLEMDVLNCTYILYASRFAASDTDSLLHTPSRYLGLFRFHSRSRFDYLSQLLRRLHGPTLGSYRKMRRLGFKEGMH